MRLPRGKLWFAAAAALVSCRRNEPARTIVMVPAHDDTSSPSPVSPGIAGSLVQVAGVSFEAPKSWRRETPSSAMRAAQFAIPGGGNEKDGLFVVYFFGSGQGGSVAENVERWKSQFSDASGAAAAGDVHTDRRNGLAVTIVTAEGTYASGMPMGPSTPEPNSELWGAIVEGPQGNVFFKATGPKATIDGAKAGFAAVLDSLRPASTTT